MSVSVRRKMIPSETDVVAKASNNVTNNMDFNFATEKAATKRMNRSWRDSTASGPTRRDHHEA